MGKFFRGSIPACALTLVLFYDDMFEAVHAVDKMFMNQDSVDVHGPHSLPLELATDL